MLKWRVISVEEKQRIKCNVYVSCAKSWGRSFAVLCWRASQYFYCLQESHRRQRLLLAIVFVMSLFWWKVMRVFMTFQEIFLAVFTNRDRILVLRSCLKPVSCSLRCRPWGRENTTRRKKCNFTFTCSFAKVVSNTIDLLPRSRETYIIYLSVFSFLSLSSARGL